MTENASPTISLVIPAWNEADFLPRLLDTVDEAKRRYRGGCDRVEIILADNDSDDETVEIARNRGCRVVTITERCIGMVRNGGAAVANGELVAFADSDSQIHPETFNYVDDILRRPEFIGGGTGITMERSSWGILATQAIVMPWMHLLRWTGGVYFCRRSDFEEAGGFDETVIAGEDALFLRALRKLGRSRRPRQQMATQSTARRLGLEPAFSIFSTRKFDERGDWHLFADIIKHVPMTLFRWNTLVDYAERYWYQGRGGTDADTTDADRESLGAHSEQSPATDAASS